HLRKFRISDTDAYYQHLGSSEAVTRYMLWKPHTSLEESCQSIEKILSRYEKRDGYCYAITLADDGSLIGRIDLLRFDDESESCSFAYMLGQEFWNRGYATEVLRAVFAFAFDRLDVRRITADHMSANPASGRVMQKAGMHYVCTHEGKYEKNGVLWDADEYTVSSEDWYSTENPT
ncbi:MAG: GNAT family N-acetyltransferase, partial [Clostridia bacterium]|nr:GNAT family N-acetyltransferase [Clostridia bacterium]